VSAPSSIDWAWALRSGGNLSTSQKLSLIRPLLGTALRYPRSRLSVALGVRGTARLDLDELGWPDSALAKAAELEAREQLSPGVLEHSYRTYLFGRLLAQMAAVPVDAELAFVTSILHDLQLEHRTPGRCFAVTGAERAQQFVLDHGVSPDTSARVGAGVAAHLTVGAADDLADLGGFVSAGAFVDITGYGLHAIDPAWVEELHARHPRHGLQRYLLETLKQEAKDVPDGRIRWMSRYGSFRTLLRLDE
jgi:hypothetical protein